MPTHTTTENQKAPRSLWIFLAGAFLSNTGTWMQMVGQGWLVAGLTPEPFWTGVVGFCNGVPILVLSLIGGTLADRMNRRRLLFFSQLSLMLIAAVLGLLTLFDLVKVWHVAVLALLTGIGTAISNPAYNGFLFDIVGREKIGKAVSLNATQVHLSRTLGPALAGLLLGAIGPGWCFILNAVSFLAVLPLIILVPAVVAQNVSEAQLESFWGNIKSAIRYIFAQPAILIALFTIALVSILVMPHMMLMALYVRTYLKLGPKSLGWLWVASGVGSVGATLFAARFSQFFDGVGVRGTLLFAMTAGAALIGLASVPSYAWMFPFLVVLGACISLVSVTSMTLMQAKVEPALRGRVLGLWGTVFQGLFPVGTLVVSTMAQATSIPIAWQISASVLIFILGLLLFRNREKRTA